MVIHWIFSFAAVFFFDNSMRQRYVISNGLFQILWCVCVCVWWKHDQDTMKNQLNLNSNGKTSVRLLIYIPYTFSLSLSLSLEFATLAKWLDLNSKYFSDLLLLGAVNEFESLKILDVKYVCAFFHKRYGLIKLKSCCESQIGKPASQPDWVSHSLRFEMCSKYISLSCGQHLTVVFSMFKHKCSQCMRLRASNMLLWPGKRSKHLK